MVMADILPLMVIGFAASLGLTPLTRQIARRVGLVDKPSARKVHQMPMPLMGGLAIYGAFMIALLLLHDWSKLDENKATLQLTAILIGATWLVLVGFIDDRYVLTPNVKFLAEIVAAISVMVAGIHVEIFHNVILDSLLTTFWLIGIINAVNFLDNMDGLAAGISAIAAFFFFVLAASQGQILVASLAAALCGSVVGFLLYNFNPATTFMGDMGSLVLGFLLGVIGIKLAFPNQELIASWMIPIMTLGLPIFDTTLVVFTRYREGRSPWQGGKDHTSHRLVTMGLSQRLAVVSLYVACFMLGMAAIIVSQAPVWAALAIGVGAAIVGVGSFVILEIARIQFMRAQVDRK